VMKFKVFTPGLLLGAAAGAYLGISGYVTALMSRVPMTHPEITPGSLGLHYGEVAFSNSGGPLPRDYLKWPPQMAGSCGLYPMRRMARAT